MTKKKYEQLELELNILTEDILTTSGGEEVGEEWKSAWY